MEASTISVQKRGDTVSVFTTTDPDNGLAYHGGDLVQHPSRFEIAHRRIGEDSRRQLFHKQEELLGRLHAHWEKKKKLQHAAVLGQYPFTDPPPKGSLNRQ